MWSMPLDAGEGNEVGVVRRTARGAAVALLTTAPGAAAAPPTSSWRRVNGDMSGQPFLEQEENRSGPNAARAAAPAKPRGPLPSLPPVRSPYRSSRLRSSE